jgi:hypothetical protein
MLSGSEFKFITADICKNCFSEFFIGHKIHKPEIGSPMLTVTEKFTGSPDF